MSKLMKLPNIKAYLALFVIYIVYGTTVGFMKIGVDTIPTALLPCLRFFFAGLILVVFCLVKGEKMPPASELKRHLLIGALLFFGGNSLVCWSVQHIPTGISAILVSATPFWMIALAAILPPHEKIHPLVWVGMTISFLGMVVLLSPHWSHPQALSPYFWPSLFGVLLMTFSWSCGSVYARKTSLKSSMLMSIGWQNLFAGLLLIPVCYATGAFHAFTPSLKSLGALVYLIFIGSMVATTCYFYVLKHLPVSVGSTFAYVTPLVSVAFGWLFLGEEVSTATIVGAAIILTGVVIVQTIGRRAPATPAEIENPKPQPAAPVCRDPDPALNCDLGKIALKGAV